MLFYVTARLRAVFALRAEFSSLSFPKEKGTKKKSDLRACALKNPPHCTELLRSIKNGMFVVAAITGRASRDEIVRSGKRKNCGCDHRSRLRRSYNFMTNRQYSMSVCNLETG